MQDDNIYVTRTYLPPKDEFQRYLDEIWERDQLTNQGPLLNKLESRIKEYLGVNDFQFVTNGTLALQIAIEALEVSDGEIITTPFSYVATTSSILWQRATPVFVDISLDTLCIDVNKIEAAITSKTTAILAVHVFGNPCDVEEIQKIATKHSLKVIYDGAHAFGVQYKGQSLFNYGDISITSFHATKIFHTIEGGGIFTKDDEVSKKVDLIKRFGHNYDDHIMLGINAKASEFQAAMGLTNLEHLAEIAEQRKDIFDGYDKQLNDEVETIIFNKDATQNYSYYPIIFKSEEKLVKAKNLLTENNIFPRRYFYPSLNTISYLEGASCPVSEDISTRVLCLPLYAGLSNEDVTRIADLVNQSQL
ncbi:MAG: aminotransferase DegT [Candidatus Saccharibacteria bacterium]|nr:aminotransferase DegT [Candidatus Saccharibacteria bacterium]